MIKFVPGAQPLPWSFFETADLLGENKPYKIVIGDKNTYTVVPTDNYMDAYKKSVEHIIEEYDAKKKSRTQLEHVYKKKQEEFEKKRKTNPKTTKGIS